METFTNFINVFNTCLSSVSSIYCVLICFVDFYVHHYNCTMVRGVAC